MVGASGRGRGATSLAFGVEGTLIGFWMVNRMGAERVSCGVEADRRRKVDFLWPLLLASPLSEAMSRPLRAFFNPPA